MHRSKIIKKRTKNRETLLRNLRKGKARQENRAGFQLIPYPVKLASLPRLYPLYADLILMESGDTLVTEASLYNNYKLYKHAQIVDYSSQRLVKIQLESKNIPLEDWRLIVEKLDNSESSNVRQLTGLVRTYCERYEAVLKEFQEELSSKKLESLLEINARSEKTRQTIIKTYPCIEFKSQLKDGQIQLTEISYSEKYLAEMGYTIDEFTTTVFKEGLPLALPLDSQGASTVCKMRLEKYLTTDPNGYQTPEHEACLIMKGGYLKKMKFKVHYYTCFEKGIPGFVFIGAITARQKPSFNVPRPLEGVKINNEFVELMSKREKEHAEFLSMYYDVKAEQKYTNMHKVCKIKDIGDQENL